MKIVLMADISRTELLVNFCIAYQQILNQHELISPLNTAHLIKGATILNVTAYPTEETSTKSQLAASARYNEIDALIYLRDPEGPITEPLIDLFRACDTNSIPFATNSATAEVLVLAISRGDLDWRELVR
ncbi:MAG: methylglyoxal synthase [Clostridiaceae bacterium]|jgi:methylglyoxal synthase|nr:methylglyoxal synthase [Clostridiaceae bacterium]